MLDSVSIFLGVKNKGKHFRASVNHRNGQPALKVTVYEHTTYIAKCPPPWALPYTESTTAKQKIGGSFFPFTPTVAAWVMSVSSSGDK